MSQSKEIQTSFFENFDILAEQVFDKDLVPEKQFAIYSKTEDKVTYTDRLELEDGRALIPIQTALIESKVIQLPSHAEGFISESNLLEEIKTFIHRYVAIHPVYETLAAYYVLMTWVYDRVPVVPYLRSMGDYGSGKTRFVQTVGSISYKPMFLAGATSDAYIFRVIELFKGTLVLNEFERVNTDLSAQITTILNNGYEKGMPVGRVEGDKTRTPTAYEVFGPKILSTRKKFEDQALESRIISVPMEPSSRKDLPLILPNIFWEEARLLRNKLLMYRFQNLNLPVLEDKSEKLVGIEPRIKQTILPLLQVVTEQDSENLIVKFATEYQKSLINDRGFELQAIVAGVVIKLFQLNDKVTLKMVSEEINKDAEDKKEEVTSHRIGKVVREDLKLKTKKVGGFYQVVYDKARVEYLVSRYGLESPLNPQSLQTNSNPNVDLGDSVDLVEEAVKVFTTPLTSENSQEQLGLQPPPPQAKLQEETSL